MLTIFNELHGFQAISPFAGSNTSPKNFSQSPLLSVNHHQVVNSVTNMFITLHTVIKCHYNLHIKKFLHSKENIFTLYQ